MSSNIFEIEQLLYRYCFAVDSGGPEDIAALFSETAVLKPIYLGEPPVEGRAAILAWFAAYLKRAHGALDHLRHAATNPVIEIDGDRASARCYMTANSVSKASGKAGWVAGSYNDKLVREDGRWLFAEREIHVQYATESETQQSSGR